MTGARDAEDEPENTWAEGQAPPEAEAPPELPLGDGTTPPAADGDGPTRPAALDEAGVDAAFADIVARWRAEAGNEPAPERARRAPGDAPERPMESDDTPAERGGRPDAERPRRGERDRRIEREIDFAVDGPSGGHFVPPEPAPLPQLDLITLFAWVAVLAGPIFLLVAALLRDVMPEWTLALAVAATISGFIVLASRLPRRGDNDPDDDGAVV